MAECLIFKHGVTIGPTGAVRPCCAFNVKPNTKNLYWQDDWKKQHAIWNEQSKTQWLDECEECRISEQQTGASLRTHYNKILEHADGINFWDLKINNTCNFACRMCNQTSSSTWANIVRKVGEQELDEYYTHKHDTRWAKEAESFTELMYDARTVKFTGGEPFLIPQVKRIIETLIEEDIAPAVTLEIITNGSHDITAWNSLFKKFKAVTVNVSIEAIGSRYEFIRAGSSWLTTQENVIKFNKRKPANTHLFVSILPMVFNRNNIDDVKRWCTLHTLEYSVSTPVINPAFMRPDALEDEELKKQLIEQSKILDSVHGTDYRNFI